MDAAAQNLVQAARAGTVTVQCGGLSQFGFRMRSDTLLALQAGWNVLVRPSVEDGGAGGPGGCAREGRARPHSAAWAFAPWRRGV